MLFLKSGSFKLAADGPGEMINIKFKKCSLYMGSVKEDSSIFRANICRTFFMGFLKSRKLDMEMINSRYLASKCDLVKEHSSDYHSTSFRAASFEARVESN